MSKPIFVLLHGAWHTPQCWDILIYTLNELGYSAVAPALPSSGSIPPTPDWSKDVETISNTVEDLVKENDVVVVMHSFSGMTGGMALGGLGKETRAAKGLKGGVIRLIYLAAFLVPEGSQHSAHGTRSNMVPEMKTDLDAGVVTVSPEDAKDMFYQDLDDATIAELVKDLRPQSVGSFWSSTTYAAWRYIPTTCIICLQDNPSTVLAIRYLVDTAKVSGQHKIEKVVEVDAGHSPFISKPEWTAEALISEISM
ncbi:alpha/beta-hydrolase [Daldinia caldariorum]|uniref:alpha/beta-hydrolase n=1 Tax=Daldinia caldariorum TaxID=326644 RepID=UPI0020073984|nr:alpha/beta-hydrolase [Daldinia caldariorum]KAI1470489.1 alpha/beta-hydrolase [Daldinia caldariorum]